MVNLPFNIFLDSIARTPGERIAILMLDEEI
jgi:hypothetical protein